MTVATKVSESANPVQGCKGDMWDCLSLSAIVLEPCLVSMETAVWVGKNWMRRDGTKGMSVGVM